MNILQTLNPENVSETEYLTYPTREAARAIVFDDNQNIALLSVSKRNHYKLPGGGKESNESLEETLKRECQEEIGCEIEIIDEVGSIIEYRKFCSLKQISYCYVAKLKGNKGTPHLMQDEVAEGYKTLWLPYSKALEAIQKNESLNLEAREYIVPRDITFLKAALLFSKKGF